MVPIDPEYERLRGVQLPAEIVALPHILEQLDVLLMTHEEAVVEASETAQSEWIKQLLPSFSSDHLEVLTIAARSGHLDIVKWLAPEIRSHAADVEADGKLEFNAVDALEEAVINAAINDRLEVVKFLMPQVKISADEEEENDTDMLTQVAWRVLDLTAEMGHVDVVKLAAEYAHETEETGPASKMSNALTNSIGKGHDQVVRFLISAPHYHWEMTTAFKQALRMERQAMVEMIYEVHPESVDGGGLIVHTARGDGARYLQNKMPIDGQMIDDAFVCVSLCERTDILEFLLGTGRVSDNLFDTGFICAARYGCLESVSFFLSTQRHSPWSIESAFENAGTFAVTKFLLENAYIPSESIVSAFKSALGLESRKLGRIHKSECSAIAVLLQAERCIPTNVLNAAFRTAASTNFPDVVTCMRGNDRLVSEVVGAAFGCS